MGDNETSGHLFCWNMEAVKGECGRSYWSVSDESERMWMIVGESR